MRRYYVVGKELRILLHAACIVQEAGSRANIAGHAW